MIRYGLPLHFIQKISHKKQKIRNPGLPPLFRKLSLNFTNFFLVLPLDDLVLGKVAFWDYKKVAKKRFLQHPSIIPPQIDDDWKKTNSHVAWWMGTVFTKGAICSFQIQYFCNETTITKRSRGKRETQRFWGKTDFMVVTFSSVISPLVLWTVHLLSRGWNKVIRWPFCQESLKVVSKLETYYTLFKISLWFIKAGASETKVWSWRLMRL